MKITIDKHPDQDPIVTIDTTPCKSIYAIREALQLALELDGHDKETIKNVFNLQEDEKTEPQAEPAFKTEYKVHDRVTMMLGTQLQELIIMGISWIGDHKTYHMGMIFREGAANEATEQICAATEDMFL